MTLYLELWMVKFGNHRENIKNLKEYTVFNFNKRKTGSMKIQKLILNDTSIRRIFILLKMKNEGKSTKK